MPALVLLKSTGGILSHGPWLQSPRWQAETIPLDHAAKAATVIAQPMSKVALVAWRSGHSISLSNRRPEFESRQCVRFFTGTHSNVVVEIYIISIVCGLKKRNIGSEN
jgi:hypothetical protein